MNIGLIIAGGKGKRFKNDIPKQFVDIDGKPLIEYTLHVFEDSIYIDKIVVVCLEAWIVYLKKLIEKCKINKISKIIPGGQSRFQSISIGVDAIAVMQNDDDIIVIHDSVRPCVTSDIIGANVQAAKKYGAALSVLPCYDTMFVSHGGETLDSVYPRDELFRGQTPESMKVKVAREAYKKAEQESLMVDSPSTLLMRLGYKVGLSESSQRNIKITTPDDVEVFRAMLRNVRVTE